MDDSGTQTKDPRDRHNLVGRVLDGRVRVEGVLGEGGMGIVYLGHQTNVDRKVAIKVLTPERSDENTVRRFKNEARAASRLHHPNTITIHDFGSYEDLLYIVMEFLEGESLQDLLNRERRMQPERVLNIISQVLGSLQEAHNVGIIHRDIKPDNIYLKKVGGKSDFVKVLDFGVAKLGEKVGGSATLTQAGMIFGTPKYMSPEQATARDLDARSDLYTTGVMMYECLTGVAPFKGDDPVSILIQHVHDPPPPFSESAPDLHLPEELESICLRALAKDPGDRFASAADMQTAVDQALLRLHSGATMPMAPPPTGPSAPVGAAQTWQTDLGMSPLPGIDAVPPSTIVKPGSSRTLLAAVLLVGVILVGAVGYLVYRQLGMGLGPGGADAGTIAEDPPVAVEDPPVTEEEARVAEEDPPVTEEDPPVAQEDPPVAQEDPPVAQEDPPVAVEDPPVAQEDPPVAQEDPPVAEEDPPVVEEDPAETVAEADPIRIRFDRSPSDVDIDFRGREYRREGRTYIVDRAEGDRLRFRASASHYRTRTYTESLGDADPGEILEIRVRLERDPCDSHWGPIDPYVCD